MASSTLLTLDRQASTIEDSTYRRIIGKLQYLSFTRPAISFCVNKLSLFMHSPKNSHWQALKRLLRYLKHTITFGFKIANHSISSLFMYSDSDWVGNPVDRTSPTGYIFYYGTTPISWSLKKQHTVTRSSTEAEYRVVASALAETNWVMNLLRELRVSLSTLPTVFMTMWAPLICVTIRFFTVGLNTSQLIFIFSGNRFNKS